MFLKKRIVRRYPVLEFEDLKHMPVPEKAVWIYDSGVGGMSLFGYVQELFDGELIYFADTDFCPYGDKKPEQLEDRIKWCLKKIEAYKPFIVIVACHTASTTIMAMTGGITVSYPIVCIEYATNVLKQLNQGVRSLGIIATRRTIESNFYQHLLKKESPGVSVYAQACPDLVPLIESTMVDDEFTVETLKTYVAPLLDARIELLVLGCTHYDFLKHHLRKIFGADFPLIGAESAQLLVAEGRLLRSYIPHRKARKSRIEDPLFVTTGKRKQFEIQMWELLPRALFLHQQEVLKKRLAHRKAILL